MLQIDTIVLPTDFSRCAEQALDHALFLARPHGAALHLFHVVELPALSLPHVREDAYVEQKKAAQGNMNALLDARDTEGLQIEQVVLPGPTATPAAPLILEYTREHDVDLIVIGTHGRRGVRHLLMGSVAEEVVREAPVPVLAVREQEASSRPHPIERILVPLDFSAHSERALAYAKELAAPYRARLVLLHVLHVPPLPGIHGLASDPGYGLLQEMEPWAHERMQEAVASVKHTGLGVEYDIVQGHPALQILDLAEESGADLIVLASHGRTGLDRFMMGSVAAHVVRAAPCPVFVVKSFGKDLTQRATSSEARRAGTTA